MPIKVKCKICNTEKIKKPSVAIKFIYCSMKCMYSDPDYLKARSLAKILLYKDKTKNPMYGKKLSEEHKWKLREGQRKIVYTDEVRMRMSVAAKKRCTDEWRLRQGVRKKKMFTPEMREIYSKRRVELFRKNDGTSPFLRHNRQGIYLSQKNDKEIKYDSSWELHAYCLLDQMDEVISYDRCDFHIKYPYSGSIHRYIPDIKVCYKDGTVDIVEIKPKLFFERNEPVRVKALAAWKYCGERNMNYKMWDEEILGLKMISNRCYSPIDFKFTRGN